MRECTRQETDERCRKTGITLEDKGIRDENGLEPMEHIFSSPVRKMDEASDDGDVLMQESECDRVGRVKSRAMPRESPGYDAMRPSLTPHSPGSGPEVDMTLISRKTPRLPPPRASTPKHTNIGSPKRMSTGRPYTQRPAEREEREDSPTRPRTQPPTNRMLDFSADNVHQSIEKPSPFKPRHALRRSTAPQDLPSSPSRPAAQSIVEVEDDVAEENDVQLVDDAPMPLDEDDYYVALPDEQDVELDEAQAGAALESPTEAPMQDESIDHDQHMDSPSLPRSGSSGKRDRSVLENDEVEHEQSAFDSRLDDSAPASKKQRGKQTKQVTIHHRNGEDETIDPALLAGGDMYEPAPTLEAALAKGTKGKGKKGKIIKDKDANRAARAQSQSVRIHESPSKLRAGSRQGSTGPVNNFHLRATTPFEDAGERVSRFGRNLIQPLKYWANETRIWNRGTIEGIVRAEEVSKPKRKVPKKKKKRAGKLDDIEEENSDAESVMADEWEDEVGVIAGFVANWDTENQMGNAEDLIREGNVSPTIPPPMLLLTLTDLAFASSSIVTRDVANSDFRYAKIMTLPFFGAGLVELPPEATKRVKNSRKMHMCFFVHAGKVMVEIGAAGVKDVTQFAIAKGGVWVVPRGECFCFFCFFLRFCPLDWAPLRSMPTSGALGSDAWMTEATRRSAKRCASSVIVRPGVRISTSTRATHKQGEGRTV